MRKPLVFVALTLAIAGCSTPEAPPSSAGSSGSVQATPSGEASPSSPVGCLADPRDITALITAAQDDPLHSVACYGDDPLTFEANWAGGGVADCPTAPEPAWLACSAFSLKAAGDTSKVGAPTLFVAVDPAIGTLPESGIDVVVTGHYDDPAAQTCHETSTLPDDSPAPVAEIVQRCRNTFVITEVTPL